MKIPSSVRILSHRYKVLVRHSRTISKIVGDESWGFYDPIEQIIYVASDAPPSEQSLIFLHELMHVLSDIGKLGLGEKRINTLAELLMEVIRSNKLRL